jgi:hypothetical protein
VAGKSWKKTVSPVPVKGKRWPYYCGIQLTGTYSDQPFIKELYYNGATTGLLLNGLKPVPLPEPIPTPPPCINCGR